MNENRVITTNEGTFTIKKIMAYGKTAYSMVDIDVNPGVDTVEFDTSDAPVDYVELRGVMKQFPDVTKLVIGSHVRKIDISNFMFPNVAEVKSYGFVFKNNTPFLIDGSGTVLNTFCKNPEDEINLKGMYMVGNYAMEGCRSETMKYLKSCLTNSLSLKGTLL